MTVEDMREAIRLSDQLAKMEESLVLAREHGDTAKISVWAYGMGRVEELPVPVKDVLRFYRRDIRRLRAELKVLTAE
jgi:hypothetical protein